MGPDIFPAEGAVKMNPPDVPAKTSMPVQHAVHIVRPFLQGTQAGVAVHQMPDIQHDPLALSPDSVQQTAGQLRLGEGEARPPLVLYQEVEGPRPVSQQEIDNLRRCIDDLLMCVPPVVEVKPSSTDTSDTWNTT